MVGQIASAVGQTIPLVCQDWANAKAAYLRSAKRSSIPPRHEQLLRESVFAFPHYHPKVRATFPKDFHPIVKILTKRSLERSQALEEIALASRLRCEGFPSNKRRPPWQRAGAGGGGLLALLGRQASAFATHRFFGGGFGGPDFRDS
jgi:hypothetical protein